MAVEAVNVDDGTGIAVLVDGGVTGKAQIVKLGYSADGSETKIGADANGLDVDVTRMSPGTGASDLGKAEDAVASSGDTGVMALAVRKDTAGADAADGDYVALHVDSSGRLQVSGTQIEDATAGSGDPGTFVLAVRRDTPTSSAAAGDYHEIQVDALGRLWVSGTQIEDAVASSGDAGVMALAIRRDTLTSDAAAGDYHALHVDELGRLQIVTGASVASQSQDSSGLTTASTNYTNGDTVGAGWTFTNMARISGGGGRITGVMMEDKADVTGSYEFWLSTGSISFGTDNAAPSPSDSDGQKLVGRISTAPPRDLGGSRYHYADLLNVPYVCDATSLFVYAVCLTDHNFFAAATDLRLRLMYELD